MNEETQQTTDVQDTPTHVEQTPEITTVPLMSNEGQLPEPSEEEISKTEATSPTFAEPNPKVEMSLKTTTVAEEASADTIEIQFIQSGTASVEKAKALISGIPEDHRASHFSDEWVQSVDIASYSFVPFNVFDKRLDAEGASWKQFVEHEGVKLRAGRPSIGKSGEAGQVLTGNKAIMKIRAVTGMGSFLQIPLWHSGIWLLLKTPTDSELLMLDQLIQHEKSTLGLSTNGLIFSNMSAYLVDILTSFVIDHVVDSTVKDSTTEKLKSLIRATDIPLLLWGIVSTIYPNGYPFAHACVVNPTVCQHIMHTVVSIPRLLWTDTAAFTKEQRKHMANRKAIYSEEEILAYQDMSEWGSARPIKLTESLRVTLRVPTLREYVAAGYKWISEINETVGDLLDKAMSSKERREYVAKQSILTMARQYGHWVKRIVGTEMTDDGPKDFVIEDQDTMDEIVSTLSSDASIFDVFIESVLKYIEDSTVAVIAIPRVACPACGNPMSEEYSKHPNLQVINVDQVFFILRLQRLTQTAAVKSVE